MLRDGVVCWGRLEIRIEEEDWKRGGMFLIGGLDFSKNRMEKRFLSLMSCCIISYSMTSSCILNLKNEDRL